MKTFATLLMLLTIGLFSIGCDNGADDVEVDGGAPVTDGDLDGALDGAETDAGADVDPDDAEADLDGDPEITIDPDAGEDEVTDEG